MELLQEFFESYLWCKKYEANLSAKVNECAWGTQQTEKTNHQVISSVHVFLDIQWNTCTVTCNFSFYGQFQHELIVFEMIWAAAVVSHRICAAHLVIAML